MSYEFLIAGNLDSLICLYVWLHSFNIGVNNFSYYSLFKPMPYSWAKDSVFKLRRTPSVAARWTALSMFLGKPKMEGSSIYGILVKKDESSFWFLGKTAPKPICAYPLSVIKLKYFLR